MKKPILTSALALALSVGAITPAYAADTRNQQIELLSVSWGLNPVAILIGLLLPAVQKAPN